MQDYRQNQIDSVTGTDDVGDAIRLLQVLNDRAKEIQATTSRTHDLATVLSFADYADGFRRVQEFLSFCDVIEAKLEHIRSEEHTSGTPVTNAHLVCRLLLEKKKQKA